MPITPGFFLEEDSEECVRVQKTLTSGRFRCNLMMVADADQAAAMLRQECETAAPDVLLVFGGLHDGRAAALLERIAQDARLSSIRFPVLVDSLQAREQLQRHPHAKSMSLGDFSLKTIEPHLEKDPELFWWVMARFS